MKRSRVFRSAWLVTGVVLISACASQSAYPPAPAGSLDEKYFQKEARNYMKFEHEGRTIYCQNERSVNSLVPHRSCITEQGLRKKVENARRARNSVAYTRY